MIKLYLEKYFTFNSISFYNERNELKFDPPVYEQRYSAVIQILEYEYWRGTIKKVIDFGCAEMKLVTLLRRVHGVEQIIEVDIDEQLLKSSLHKVRPLVSDYINLRKHPLRIDVYKGSVDTPVTCLNNADAVIAVELIEHLYPNVLEGVPLNIFGFIKPKIAIITTPNSEFNVMFNLTLENGFRHADHKFEWTRAQFKDWCLNICSRFPNYNVCIEGIGKGPPEARKYGDVSQMAIFIRKDILGYPLVTEKSQNNLNFVANSQEESYTLLISSEFPYEEDNRDHNQKILDETNYHIRRYTEMGERYFNEEKNLFMIPLSNIFNFVCPLTITEGELKDILIKNNFKFEDEFICIQPEEDESDESCKEDCHNIDLNALGLQLDEKEEECWD